MHNKKKYVNIFKCFILFCFAICLIACGHKKEVENINKHNNLNVQENFKSKVVSNLQNDRVQISSITAYSDDKYLICNYEKVFLTKMNSEIADLNELAKPDEVKIWNPTGVFYDKVKGILYVANYNGHNIVKCSIDENTKKLKYLGEINDKNMVSPENVSVDENGNNIAVADYDGNNVLYFNSKGELLWKIEIKLAHGVAVRNNYIYATSLNDRQIIKIDSRGNIIAKIGTMGLNENEYLWPTSIDISKDNTIMVTDAHAGKISFFKTDLTFIESIGCNGPGVNNFNYPYSSIFVNNKIIVADTFKARVLELDGKTKNVLNQYCFSDTNNTQKVQMENNINESSKNPYTYRAIKLNVEPEIFNPLIDKNLEVFSGFNSIDVVTKNQESVTQFEIDSPGANYSNKLHWYMTWCTKIEREDRSYYIIASPQHSQNIVIDAKQQIFTMVDDRYFDKWLIKDKIYVAENNDKYLDEVISNAKIVFDKYQLEINKGCTRLEAFKYVFCNNKDNELESYINNRLTSKFAKEFILNFKSGIDIDEASKRYFISTKDEPIQYLMEDLLIMSISAPINSFDDIGQQAKIINETSPYNGYGINNSLDDDDKTYTSYNESKNPSMFELKWDTEVQISDILIEWLDKENIGTAFEVLGYDINGKEEKIYEVKDNNNLRLIIKNNMNKSITKVKFIFYNGKGQNRLLLRNFKLYNIKQEIGTKKMVQNEILNIKKKIDMISKFNEDVSKVIKYGVGKGDVPAEDVLAYGKGQCGDYCYLLFRKLIQNKIEARIVDITSSYKNAIHSLVEVNISDKWYTFDPTYGIYYENSIQELIDNPTLIENMVGEPLDKTAYIEENFFFNPIEVKYIYDIDYRDKNIASKDNNTKIILNNKNIDNDSDLLNVFEVNSGEKYYDFYNKDLAQQILEVQFNKEQEFYRIKAKFESNENMAKKFQLEYHDIEDDTYKIISKEDNYNKLFMDNIYEIILKNPIKTDRIRFTLNETYSGNNFYIRNFWVFK